MADTLQCVTWHLAHACPFRQGAAVDEFMDAWNATWRLGLIGSDQSRQDIFNDICVTGASYYKGDSRPFGGFRISDVVPPVGSLELAKETCQGCPANAKSPQMAGCCGVLSCDPEDRDMEAAIRAAIRSRKLERAYQAAFQSTQPHWYGLWIASPLTRAQLELLPLLRASVKDKREELVQFRKACGIAIREGISLHVRLAAPGHTDFGLTTTFPHCPKCKKKATGPEWGKYSMKSVQCAACGNCYIPASTASEEKDGEEMGRLESHLPPDEYAALCAQWRARHARDNTPGSFGAAPEPPKPRRSFLGRLWDSVKWYDTNKG